MGGSIKVKLKDKIQGYDNEFVYLVTACLSNSINLDNSIDVMASKLKKNEPECYYYGIMNVQDSKGIPFYNYLKRRRQKFIKPNTKFSF